MSWITSDDWQLGWRFSGFVARPNDVRRLYVRMRQMKYRGQFFDIEDVSPVDKETSFVFLELFSVETCTTDFKTIQVCRVELLKGPY